jgi:4-hydroxybenzoate polyprenyltransferase
MIGFFLGIFGTRIIHEGNSPGTVQLILRFGLVLICMVSARSAAMAFNRYLDRNFDARNPRTAIREIPRGIIAPNNALRFVIICCTIFTITCWFINPICFYLSPVALFVILFYSYTKRFTALCHVVLGLGLSLAPIGAFLAVTGHFEPLPLLFSGAVICWVSGFDIIYAMQDVEFDKSENLYSIPAALGKKNALRISVLLHVLSVAFVVGAGFVGGFGEWYWVGIFLFTGMLIYQHLIVKPNDLSRVNLAFMTANGIASVVFAFFVIADIYITHKHW